MQECLEVGPSHVDGRLRDRDLDGSGARPALKSRSLDTIEEGHLDLECMAIGMAMTRVPPQSGASACLDLAT